MDSFLQSSIPTPSLSHGAPYNTNTGNVSTLHDVFTFSGDISFERDTAQPSTQIISRHNENQDPVTDAENGEKGEENGNAFEVVAINNEDDSDDENWNIRADYEEKDHVYYMPPGAYRSYVLGYWKKDEDEKEDSKDTEPKQTSNEFEVSSNEKSEDEDSEDWNIRSDFEEKDFVYQMPSGTYRSYEPGSWKMDNAEDDGKVDGIKGNDGKGYDVDMFDDDLSGNEELRVSNEKYSEMETDSSSSDTESTTESIDDYLDLTSPKTMANRPRIPTEKVFRGNLCRVCRNFHDAKNAATEKRRTSKFVKKLLSWRKKSHDVPCARCGCAVDRRSLLRRMFGLRSRTTGTF